MTDVDGLALTIFILLFGVVSVLGFIASRWRAAADLEHLDEWGLGGRSFGTVITWFLLGGDLYTAYTFIAIPALVYGAGALGMFGLTYTVIVYPIVFVVMPRLWSVSHRHGYVTPADFVRGRHGSPGLALAIAVTGILATMPYIALQLVGIQVVLEAMGVGGDAANVLERDLPLIVAFLILALYTYNSGLRAPALIAFVKDVLVYLVVIVCVFYIPHKLGGWSAIFDAAGRELPTRKTPGALILGEKSQVAYSTLALGSAMALFMYPHAITAVLSSGDRNVIRRNAVFLPAYSFLLGIIGLLGFMAIAAEVDTGGNNNLAVPLLFQQVFPEWFVGVAFGAIAIGALVPAAVMSIAAANLFTRNVYKEYLRPAATPREEAKMAKLVSLVVKLGAVGFILFLNLDYAINLQLLGGVWMLQTFPSIVFALWTRWFHRYALLAGWAVGMVLGTSLAASQSFRPTYPMFGTTIYIALIAFVVNVALALVLTPVLRGMRVPDGVDATEPDDYEATAVPPLEAAPVATSAT